jgi:hypothetical protein
MRIRWSVRFVVCLLGSMLLFPPMVLTAEKDMMKDDKGMMKDQKGMKKEGKDPMMKDKMKDDKMKDDKMNMDEKKK